VRASCARSGCPPPPVTLPVIQQGRASDPPLQPEQIAELQREVRTLARDPGAIVLAHNYQLPEVQAAPAPAGRIADHMRVALVDELTDDPP
jgi:quinolinate synthase